MQNYLYGSKHLNQLLQALGIENYNHIIVDI